MLDLQLSPQSGIRCSKYPAVDFHGRDTALRLNGKDIHRTVAELRSAGIKKTVNMNVAKEAAEMYPDFFVPFIPVDKWQATKPDFASYISDSFKEAREKGVMGIEVVKAKSEGEDIPIDDPRLVPVWETAAEMDMPILIHFGDSCSVFETGMAILDRLMEANPRTDFVVAHCCLLPENLDYLDRSLDRFPNMMIDISDRISELGRAPYSARRFFLKHADRILFGTESDNSDALSLYPPYFRFLETFDEYFDYSVCDGRWKIYGIGLPDEVLRKVYYKNAESLLA